MRIICAGERLLMGESCGIKSFIKLLLVRPAESKVIVELKNGDIAITV